MSESQLIEYKESWRDEYLKWICGFANAQGGVLYIGRCDDGSVCGVADFFQPCADELLFLVCHAIYGYCVWCAGIS